MVRYDYTLFNASGETLTVVCDKITTLVPSKSYTRITGDKIALSLTDHSHLPYAKEWSDCTLTENYLERPDAVLHEMFYPTSTEKWISFMIARVDTNSPGAIIAYEMTDDAMSAFIRRK
jgi:hypothetical protein